jgi:hypothetical protein
MTRQTPIPSTPDTCFFRLSISDLSDSINPVKRSSILVHTVASSRGCRKSRNPITAKAAKDLYKDRKEARALRNSQVGYFSEGARLKGWRFNFACFAPTLRTLRLKRTFSTPSFLLKQISLLKLLRTTVDNLA